MKFTTLSLVLCLSATPALAQMGPPKPNDALAPYAQAFGHWTGSGTHAQSADAESAPWTATLSIAPILGGHAVREELHVDLGEALPGGYRAVTIHTYDPAQQHLVVYSGDNMVGTMSADAAWIGNQLVIGGGGIGPEGMTVERSVWTFGEKEATIEVTGMKGVGAPFPYVTGTFQRTDKAPVDASAARTAPSGKLEPMRTWLGAWRVTGEVVPMPGMPAVPVAGIETITCWPGGKVLEQQLVGDDNPMFGVYEMYSMVAWDEAGQRYRRHWVDSMGMCGSSEGWLQDEATFVETHSGEMMGIPYAERSVVKLGEGGPESVVSDRISADGEAERTMTIRYERAKK